MAQSLLEPQFVDVLSIRVVHFPAEDALSDGIWCDGEQSGIVVSLGGGLVCGRRRVYMYRRGIVVCRWRMPQLVRRLESWWRSAAADGSISAMVMCFCNEGGEVERQCLLQIG